MGIQGGSQSFQVLLTHPVCVAPAGCPGSSDPASSSRTGEPMLSVW